MYTEVLQNALFLNSFRLNKEKFTKFFKLYPVNVQEIVYTIIVTLILSSWLIDNSTQ